jgi:phosphotriesterase-related protein
MKPMFVETATGPVDSSELGITLAHEHLAITTDGVPTMFPRTFDRSAAVEFALKMLDDATSHGVKTIVDLTVFGLGRDIDLMREIASRAPVNVIVATGMYVFTDLPLYFANRTADDMAELFIADLCEGVGTTDSKAAILKCATDKPGVTEGVDKVLRACARAARATKRPISTHTDALSHRGLDQIRIFEDEGVDLENVVIGHCGDTNDLEYLEAVASKGCIMGMDRFGVGYGRNPLDKRVETIIELCKRGWSKQIVLSHDCPCTIDWFPAHPMGPSRSMTLVFTEVIPALLAGGISQDDIDQMLIHTPRRLLEGSRR